MNLITWRKEFCTGISSVDYEHEKLIEQINSVYALVDDRADKDSVIDSLGEIYGSISAHFILEEKMMETHSYDQIDEHKADHERLLEDIGKITDDYENTTELDNVKLKKEINGWFQVHFKTHDARLHNMANMMSHDEVDASTMKTMIGNAKKSLLSKIGLHSE